MSKINWSRVVACGLLAGLLWIVLGSVVTPLLGHDFATVPHNRLGEPTPGFLLLNVLVDLLEGISIIWLYAAVRPRYGPGGENGSFNVICVVVHRHFGRHYLVLLRIFPLARGRTADDRDAACAHHCHARGCQVLQGVDQQDCHLNS